MEYEPRNRIWHTTYMFMLLVATLLWILSFFPLLDWIMDPLSWVVFHFWFKACGASFVKKGKNTGGGFFGSIGFQIFSFLIGLLPFVITDILDAFPIVVYSNIRRVHKEDEIYNAEMYAQYKQKWEQMRRDRALYLQQLDQEVGENIAAQQYANEEQEIEEERQNSEPARKAGQDKEPEGGIGQDALDVLNNKPDKTYEEKEKLKRAKTIYETGMISVGDRNDPVLLAAYNKRKNGVKKFDPNTGTGFKFNI